MASSFPLGLPTPAPSTEIHAKPLETGNTEDSGSFELPPAALSSNNSVDGSVSSAFPSLSPTVSARSAGKSAPKRRASTSTAKNAAQEYILPPPPTRSRKIIQMKPRANKPESMSEASTTALKKGQAVLAPAPSTKGSPTSSTTPTTTTSPSAPGPSTSGGKRKQSSASAPTTAAGRKMARKTAHSLIERRRRSKMNEEFGVLKDMIPECKGQEMHKLAILQASIRYMRWLEENLSKLGAVHSKCATNQGSSNSPLQHLRSNTTSPASTSEDTEMRDLPSLRQALATHPQHANQVSASASASASASVSLPASQHPTPNPQMFPRLPSLTSSMLHQPISASVSPQQDPMAYPFILPPPLPPSALSSPAITSRHHGNTSSSNLTMLTSPAISPMQMPEDHEATAALLMLNTDRRSWNGESKSKVPKTEGGGSASTGGRGMSVRDLLG